jgi:RNA polymerase sigma-70 factor, ECF subfamily
MSDTPPSEIAEMLRGFGEGNGEASEQLMSLLYSELHLVAERMMARQPAGQTLQATALVSEAYLRLAKTRGRTWTDRAHLISAAAQAMRTVLIDHARRRATRGTDARLPESALDHVLVSYQERVVDLVELDGALKRLAEFAPQMARAVDLRFFAGLTMAEVADILEMPKRKLEREWEAARAWLLNEMT